MLPLPSPRFDNKLVAPIMMPRMPPPMNSMFGGPNSLRQRLPPPRLLQFNGAPFLPQSLTRNMVPGNMSPMVPCNSSRPHPPIMRHWHRRMPPRLHMMPSMRPKFVANNDNIRDKIESNIKKVNKTEAYLHQNNEKRDNQRDRNDNSEDDTLYYCGVCDRDFSSDNALTEHKSTHRLCGIDGCKFSAHPLLVEKHINMQHSTGLYAKMKDLSEEEGAKKWAEERKRRFPTKSNIKLREAEDLEKIQRGEIIKQDRHVFKITRTMNTRGKKRKPQRRLLWKTDNYSHVDEIYRGVRPFPGTKMLQEENSSDSCLDEETEMDINSELDAQTSDMDDNIPQASKSTNISIPSLVANYDSEVEDSPEEVPIKRIKIEDLRSHNVKENVTVLKETVSDAQSYTNASEDKSNHQTINEISRHSVTKRQDKQKHKTKQIVVDKIHEKVSTRHHNKLLQMLLSRSIQYERNLISQCLKFIIDNNFFESSEI